MANCPRRRQECKPRLSGWILCSFKDSQGGHCGGAKHWWTRTKYFIFGIGSLYGVDVLRAHKADATRVLY